MDSYVYYCPEAEKKYIRFNFPLLPIGNYSFQYSIFTNDSSNLTYHLCGYTIYQTSSEYEKGEYSVLHVSNESYTEKTIINSKMAKASKYVMIGNLLYLFNKNKVSTLNLNL